MKYLLIIIGLSLIVLGCSQTNNVPQCNEPYILVGTECCLDQNANNVCDTDEEAVEIVEEVEEEEEELVEEETLTGCNAKALPLIPDTILIKLHSSKDPDTSAWDISENQTFTDGVEIDLKGDIKFYKGSKEGENVNYWYTTNIANENLFGVGGLKYSHKVTNEDGVQIKNEFIIKPVLNPIGIKDPETIAENYLGTFELIDVNIVECDFP